MQEQILEHPQGEAPSREAVGEEEEMSKRVALYARVSTRDQDCQLQLADLKAMATARGFEVAGPYVDQGAS
ncbi:MAG: recombinase family protein [Acidobacteriota bacterium]